MSRELNKLVLHCSGTPRNWMVADLKSYFYEEKGWQHPGYHIVFERDGRRHDLLPLSKIANGVKGHNSDSIHISYMGGIDEDGNPKDTRTEAQEANMLELVRNLLHTYPHLGVFGHRDLLEDTYINESSADTLKACPCFNANEWVKNNL